METGVNAALEIWSVPRIQSFFHLFVHLWLDYFQTEFEAAHKISMVKISPQTTNTEMQESQVIKGMGMRKIISKNQTDKGFFYCV